MSKYLVAAVYDNHSDADEAVKLLLKEGVLKRHISVLGKGEEAEKETFEDEKENEVILAWGEQGAFWGGLWGLLAGGIYAFVPGFGPILATGHVIAALAGLIGGAATVGALSAFAAMLVEMGIEAAEAKRYEHLLKENKLLVIVHGDDAEVETARQILENYGRGEVKVHAES